MKTKPEVLKLAKGVRAVVLDVDGVLAPDAEIILPNGGIAKVRSHNDGQGISLLRAMDIKVVFITSEDRDSPGCEFIARLVEKWNSLPSSCSSSNPDGWPEVCLLTDDRPNQDKGDLLRAWVTQNGLCSNDCVVMGDDLVDVPMLRLGGLKVAPAQAEKTIIDMVDWVTSRPGGGGAVRDLANLILSARGIDPLSLPTR